MAGINAVAQSPEISSGTAKKTLLQITAPTNQRLKIREISVAFKGTSNTAAPVLVEVARQSTAGTMTSLTPQKWNPADDETLQGTAQHTATAEPTETAVIMREEVHPQGAYTWQAPFGGEIIVPGGGRLGIAVTAAADVSSLARLVYEE